MAKTWTVLVVDDDPRVRKLSRATLERLGLIVVEASDGEQALHVFQQSQADLVVLDAMMPRLDGFAVCRRIRQQRYGATVPVIMVTALSDSDAARRAREVQATEYVTKPVNWGWLGQRIRHYLEPETAPAA